MRTHLSIGVLVCVIGMTCMARDAEAFGFTSDKAPEIASFADPTDLPANITVSPDLQHRVAQMLRESEIFRRQCGQIARLPWLRVYMMLEDPPDPQRPVRAQTDLLRYEFGSITARVHVWSRDDAIELIAHELEHVIEVAEGINYRAMSGRPLAVWTADGRSFETSRAIYVGLEVKREVRLASVTLATRVAAR